MEFLELLNVDSSKLGKLIQALDKTAFGSQLVDGKSFLGGCMYKEGSTWYKIGVVNNAGNTQAVIYRVESGGNTAIKSDLTASLQVDFASLLGYLFAINTTDGLITSNDLVTTPTWGTVNAVGAPKGSMIIIYDNEPYIAGDLTAKSRVYRGHFHNPAVEAVAYVSGDQTSATMTTLTVDSTKYLKVGMKFDIYTAGTLTKVEDSIEITSIVSDTVVGFSSTNVAVLNDDEIYLEDTRNPAVIRILWDTAEDNFDIQPDDGFDIKGFAVNSNRLITWKDNSMWRWDKSQNVCIDPTIGCSSKKSIVTIGKYTFWIYKNVWYVYDGSTPTAISSKVESIFNDISDNSICVGIGDNLQNRIYLYIGDIDCDQMTASDVWAVYDIKKDLIEFRQDIPCTVAFQDVSGVGPPKMYIGDEDGVISELNAGTTTATGFSSKRKFLDQGAPEKVKGYYAIITISDQPGGTIGYGLNYEKTSYKTLGDIKKKMQAFKFPENTLGDSISFWWYGASSGKRPSLLGVALLYWEEGYDLS